MTVDTFRAGMTCPNCGQPMVVRLDGSFAEMVYRMHIAGHCMPRDEEE